MTNNVTIIGAGLAGSEAAYQLAKRGVNVKLYEMKPHKFTPAHKNTNFAELVCSNSLKAKELTTSSGLLKKEMEMLDSLIIKAAYKHSVSAGGALAVDRDKFSEYITETLKSFDNIEIINEEVTKIPENEVVIIATGPLSSDEIIKDLQSKINSEYLYFFDASSPIVTAESINMDIAFVGDRYGKGNGDYINCPMNKEEYLKFYSELINAESVKLHEFENKKVFEGCMPVEVMAKRGEDSIRFGPLKPVGLANPHKDEKPYAVVQLRKEDNENRLYNLVGFQTNLTYPEQKRVFSMIPGLEKANFVRYGVMHRNSYINAPTLLTNTFQLKSDKNIFVAGQLSGVEGYLESTFSGLIAAINVYQMINNKKPFILSPKTMFGAIINYITNASPNGFQPMNSNYGIIEPLTERVKDDKLKKQMYAERSILELERIIKETEV